MSHLRDGLFPGCIPIVPSKCICMIREPWCVTTRTARSEDINHAMQGDTTALEWTAYIQDVTYSSSPCFPTHALMELLHHQNNKEPFRLSLNRWRRNFRHPLCQTALILLTALIILLTAHILLYIQVRSCSISRPHPETLVLQKARPLTRIYWVLYNHQGRATEYNPLDIRPFCQR